ncbi:ribosomal protein S18 acetylase RimI-like enzyme [Amorphus suaedae]
MISLTDIQALEERAFNAWPSRRTVMADGWLYRLGDGYTNRANSVNACVAHPPFAGVLETAETLYPACGLQPVFRLSPLAPPEADAVLHEAGYAFASPTVVLTAPVTGHAVCDLPEACSVRVVAHPSDDWMEGFAGLAGLSASSASAHAAIVRAIAVPAGFATVLLDGRPVGYGLAVHERGAVGLFDLVISEGARRRGLGRALITALLAWGRGLGATSAYLQVAVANEGALRLYDRLGFSEAYRYHYRIKPQ